MINFATAFTSICCAAIARTHNDAHACLSHKSTRGSGSLGATVAAGYPKDVLDIKGSILFNTPPTLLC